MPCISEFYGILIYLYWDDHQPPHFHAKYAEFEILVNINTLEVIEGKFPKRARAMVIEWALDHRDELLEGWEACRSKQHPKQIAPLA
jgi:hypothetical protein